MIRLICVGKLKEKYLLDAFEEYRKRLSKYTPVEYIEISDEGMEDEIVVLRKEKEKIDKYLTGKEYLITLEIEGKELTSLEFAEKIDQWHLLSSNLTFLIGGSYGLDPELKRKSDFALSFSKMTFPHQLFRIMLTEQLYRSYKILNHERYHK